MPSPVGHTIAGLAVALISQKRKNRRYIFPIILCVFFATVPDFDFIPGLLMNRPALFHGDLTHSIGFAFVISAVAAVSLRLKGLSILSTFTLGFTSYLTHLLLDLFNPDGRPPYGIPLLWPISETYYLSPWTMFTGVQHASSTSTTTLDFLRQVITFHNIKAIGVEILLVTPISILIIWLRHKYASKAGKIRSEGVWKENRAKMQ
ncbi:MAG: metal-dependent hydrolase [Chloroflexi bacterium]|nr:MAG: metal-dependent hydrolase [Chloroflexota bacterium]